MLKPAAPNVAPWADFTGDGTGMGLGVHSRNWRKPVWGSCHPSLTRQAKHQTSINMKTAQIVRQVWGGGQTLTPAQYQTLLEENGKPEGDRSALHIALDTLGLWEDWNEAGGPRNPSWFLQNTQP